MYQQINLSDHTPVGAPGPLPANLVGLPDAAVADISAACSPPPPGMAGQGWWRVVVMTPAVDPRAQALDGTLALGAPDPATRTVPATANLRPLTAAELAALPPRIASAKQVRYALSALGVREAWEAAAGPGKATQAMQDWWGWTDPLAENATKLGRLCAAVSITPAKLFDQAVAE